MFFSFYFHYLNIFRNQKCYFIVTKTKFIIKEFEVLEGCFSTNLVCSINYFLLLEKKKKKIFIS